MSSSSESKEDVTQIQHALSVIKSKGITYNSRQGYFISAKNFEIFSDLVQNPELGAKTEEIEELREKLKERIDQDKLLDELRGKLNAKSQQYASLLQHNTKVQEERKSTVEALTLEAEQFVAHIQQLESAIKTFQKEKAEVIASKNVDAAAEVATDLKDTKQQLKSVRAELAGINAERDQLRQQLLDESTSVKNLKVELDAAHAEFDKVAKIRTDLFRQDLVLKGEGPSLVKIKSIIGQRGIDFFLQADLDNRLHAREKTYNLMMALKKSSSSQVEGLSELARILFEWVKRQPNRAKSAAMPWVEGLISDIKSGTLKSLQYYRKKLEEIVKDVVHEAKKAHDRSKKFAGEKWYQNLAKRILNQAMGLRDALKRHTPGFPTMSKIKSLYIRGKDYVASLFRPKYDLAKEVAENEELIFETPLSTKGQSVSAGKMAEKPFVSVKHQRGRSLFMNK